MARREGGSLVLCITEEINGPARIPEVSRLPGPCIRQMLVSPTFLGHDFCKGCDRQRSEALPQVNNSTATEHYCDKRRVPCLTARPSLAVDHTIHHALVETLLE